MIQLNSSIATVVIGGWADFLSFPNLVAERNPPTFWANTTVVEVLIKANNIHSWQNRLTQFHDTIL